MINSELSRLKQEMPEEIRVIDLDIISEIIQNNLDFFTENKFPHDTWTKCGYISYGLMRLYDELQYKVAFELDSSKMRKGKSAEELFREEFTRSSL